LHVDEIQKFIPFFYPHNPVAFFSLYDTVTFIPTFHFQTTSRSSLNPLIIHVPLHEADARAGLEKTCLRTANNRLLGISNIQYFFKWELKRE
jgi:hypothetical protein